MGYASKEARNAWERRKRAEAAVAAGRPPGRTGRPPTGRKAPKGHGDRAGQERRARERERLRRGDNGWTESRHPTMDEAQRATERHIRRDHRTTIMDPLYEDCLMAAALAICQGRDPDEAVVANLRWERGWRRVALPLLLA